MRILLILAFTMVSACTNCTKPANPAVSQEAQKNTSQTKPEINLDGLTKTQKEFLIGFTNDEICPCDCPKTFAGCLNKNTKCGPAKVLANWMTAKLKEGFPQDVLAQAVSKEIAGFNSESQKIECEGYGFKGSASAPVEIVEFADFQCAHCKTATAAVKDLVKKYPNKVKLTYKHFPLQGHPMAKPAAIAAEAAAQQDKYWEMHRALFSTQNFLSDKLILGHAKAIGLNLEKFKQDIKDKKIISKVDKSSAEAKKLGLEGTPSFFFNNRPYNLGLDMSSLELRLNMELARPGASCS